MDREMGWENMYGIVEFFGFTKVCSNKIRCVARVVSNSETDKSYRDNFNAILALKLNEQNSKITLIYILVILS
jgi:hypothetical protein